ncbi:MAG: helix-turn-helix domain-containing protein, partial [Anaerolineae bacterium]
GGLIPMADTEKLLGITKAARLLGVHPLTLRSWADKGHIAFLRTPGGHRRFRRGDLTAFLAKMEQGQPETTLTHIAQQAVQRAIAALPDQPSEASSLAWQARMSDKQRGTMRTVGQKLLGLVIQYVAGDAAGIVLDKGRAIGYTYGKFARQNGLSMSETVATFNFFRDTIIETTFEMPANAVDIDASNPQLYRRLNHFFNEVLLATVQAAEGLLK